MAAPAVSLATPAQAAGPNDPVVTLAAATNGSTTQPSGNAFAYAVNIGCSFLSGATPAQGDEFCDDMRIEIPVPNSITSLPGFDASWFSVPANDFLKSPAFTLDTSGSQPKIVIHVVDRFPAGQSVQLPFTFTPPNHVTPDGTAWTFTPVARGSNFDTVTGPNLSGTATASLTHTVSKSRAYATPPFVERGTEVGFRITVACTQPAKGAILAQSLVVTDTMPAHIINIAAITTTPAPTISGNTITWTLTGNQLPASCRVPGSTASRTFEVSGTVGPHAPLPSPGASNSQLPLLTNSVAVEGTTTDGQTLPSKTDAESIRVIDSTWRATGDWEKVSFGQLLDETTPPPVGNVEERSHTTHPGNWNGFVLGQQGYERVLRKLPNLYGSPSMAQAGFSMKYSANRAGMHLEVRDPVPCLDSGTVPYTSKSPKWNETRATPFTTTDLCQAPAFHVKSVTAFSDWTQSVPALSANYRPYVVYTNGSTADMVPNGQRDLPNNWGSFDVPEPGRDDVAMVVFPPTAGLSGATQAYFVHGYADASLVDLDVLRNISSAKEYWQGNDENRAPKNDHADLYIVDRPQVGVEKQLGSHASNGVTSLKVTGRLISPTAATEDFVVTDLLPRGMKVDGTLTAALKVSHRAAPPAQELTVTSDPSAPGIEVIDDWKNTGRQLIRFTRTAADLAAFGGLTLEVTITGNVKYDLEPGTYSNQAQVYYTDADLMPSCQQASTRVQQASESADLNENGSMNDRTCVDIATVTVPRTSGPASMRTVKTVKGDSDSAHKAYPGIGRITTAGGSAEFGISLKNTGGADLEDAVIYDVLPTVGDKGVGSSTSGQNRGSQFTPTFSGLTTSPLPAGVTVEYSTEANPCRDEVLPDSTNTSCVDDWSATAPATLADVTALRISSSGIYVPGQGFEIFFTMQTPSVQDNTIAWNSIAGSALPVGSSLPLVNEPPKVGITATSSTLPLVLTKDLGSGTDPANVALGEVIDYRLTVTNNDAVNRRFTGFDQLPSGLDFISVSGVAGATTTGVTHDVSTNRVTFTDIEVLPGKTLTWTVRAKVRPTALGDLVNRFTSPGGEGEEPCTDDPEGECVTVTVPPSSLVVSKVVDGSGAALAGRDFEVTVTCTVTLGSDTTTVLAETVNFTSSLTSKTFAVARGAECEVEETEDGGAHATSITPASVTIAAPAHSVTVTNTFDSDSFTIVKQVEGPGAALAEGPYSFAYSCVRGSGTPKTGTLKLTGPGTSDPVGPFLEGTVCTVTETDDAGADSTPAPVVVTVGTDLTAEFTNTFSAGSVTVLKRINGTLPSALVPTQKYEAEVTCRRPGGGAPERFTVELTAGVPTTLERNGATARFLTGTECSVQETRTGGATSTTVSDNVTVGKATGLQTLQLELVNAFDAGHLVVAKELKGTGAELTSGSFVFDVLCTFRGREYTESVTLARDALTSAPVGPFPIGADCTVTETDNGGADSTPDPVTVTIEKNATDDTVTAAITNTFSAGTITVDKVTKGRYAEEWDDASFVVEVTCRVGETETLHELTVTAGTSTVVSDAQSGQPVLFPVGTRCWAEETDDGGATRVKVSADSEDSAVTVPVSADGGTTPLAITVTNTFSQARPLEAEQKEPEVAPRTTGRSLPEGGSEVSAWMPAGAAGLITVGALLAWRGRRQRAA